MRSLYATHHIGSKLIPPPLRLVASTMNCRKLRLTACFESTVPIPGRKRSSSRRTRANLADFPSFSSAVSVIRKAYPVCIAAIGSGKQVVIPGQVHDFSLQAGWENTNDEKQQEGTSAATTQIQSLRLIL